MMRCSHEIEHDNICAYIFNDQQIGDNIYFDIYLLRVEEICSRNNVILQFKYKEIR